MKKIIILLAFVLVPFVSSASTISLSPETGTIYNGDSQKISIVVNPQSDKVYTTKIELKYPTGLFEVKSFTFSDGWMPLSQKGYDLIDNANGILIKTAGFAGGLTDSKVLGIFYLVPKKIGVGNVSVTKNSFNLDATNKNTNTNIASYSFNVIAKPAGVKTANTTDKTLATTSTSTGTNVATALGACSNCEKSLTIAWIIIALLLGFFVGRRTNLLKKFLPKE